MIQQPHQPQQEYSYMRSIRQQSTSLGITTRFGYLREPNGGIDGECLVGESLDGDAFTGGEEEAPEIFDSHDATIEETMLLLAQELTSEQLSSLHYYLLMLHNEQHHHQSSSS